jgi:mycoredoxin
MRAGRIPACLGCGNRLHLRATPRVWHIQDTMQRATSLLAFSLLAWGCPKPATSPATAGDPASGATAALPGPITFAQDEDHFLFSYVDSAGAVRSADHLKDVPEDRRKNLMVVDLQKTPEERQADKFVFFVDATVKNPEGKLQALPVSRYQVGPAVAGNAAETFQADAQANDVVVYSAEWCGYCKKTKAFLKQRGVPYRERDVEKDAGADRELQAKAQKAGVRVSGVPVTDFKGQLVMGFDQNRLEQLIAQTGAPSH